MLYKWCGRYFRPDNSLNQREASESTIHSNFCLRGPCTVFLLQVLRVPTKFLLIRWVEYLVTSFIIQTFGYWWVATEPSTQNTAILKSPNALIANCLVKVKSPVTCNPHIHMHTKQSRKMAEMTNSKAADAFTSVHFGARDVLSTQSSLFLRHSLLIFII